MILEEYVADSAGPRRRLSRCRTLSIDVLHYHRQVPTCAHDRICNFSRLEELRRSVPRRISWTMLFLKAYGKVAADCPQLRQIYMSWPWAHVYQHPHSVAMLAVERHFRDERWLFWGRFSRPEKKPLLELQQTLERYQREPVEDVFHRQLQISGIPKPLRRCLWWWTLNISTRKRVRRTGSYFLTTLAAQGAEIQHPPAFLTTNVTYGPLDASGRCRVTVAYDHRLMDGVLMARNLAELESTLNGPIREELEQLVRSAQLQSGRVKPAAA